MDYTTREVPFSFSDFDLFGQDISPADYEFFKKHTGAFKRMLQDQSKEKKQEFVDAFREFSLRNGCLKDCSGKNDGRLVYIDEAASFYKENFVNGKFSTAKNIVIDAVTLAQNKHLLQNMGAKSYSKDPFFHKETRDVFRRLFGLPSLNVTFMKVICILPLHIKFGGSLCRYLRRWLEAEPVKLLPPQPVKPPKTTSKKEKKDTKTKEDHVFKHEKSFEFSCDFHHITQLSGLSGVRAVLETSDFNLFGKNERRKEMPEEKPAKRDSAKEKGPIFSTYVVSAFSKDRDNDSKTSFKSDEKTASKSSKSDKDKRVTDEKKKLDLVDLLSDDKKKSSSSSLNEEKKSSSILKDDVYQVREEKFPDLAGESSSETDDSMEEIRKMLLLNQPHPNVQFDQLLGKLLSEENEEKLKKCKESAEKTRKKQKDSDFYTTQKRCDEFIEVIQRKQREIEVDELRAKMGRTGDLRFNGYISDPSIRTQELIDEMKMRFPEYVKHKGDKETKKKRHACANCRKVEPEPNTFKKCQRCHGKRTRFYCSRSCQEKDWASHREDHNSIEDVT